jgi:type I restriction enzyme S subunit
VEDATPKFGGTSKNISGGHIDFKKVKFISRQDYSMLSRNRPILAGDFLISMIGTIGEIARVKETDLDFYGQNMYLIRLNGSLILSGYFLHFFDSPKMKSHFNATKNNSGQGYLKANNIEDILVPIPSLEEQARIVAILDKFDALTNSITEGLPREIELRQKQYEHYRDLLLGFPKDHPALTGTPPEEGNVFGVSVAENRSAPVFPSSGGVPEGRGGSL